MTPKIKIVKNVIQDSSTRKRITFRSYIWWTSSVAKLQIGRLDFHTQKTRGNRPSPHFAQNRPIAPLTCPHTPTLVRIGCALPYLFLKDLFFKTKFKYNIGFQPTMISLTCGKIAVSQVTQQELILYA